MSTGSDVGPFNRAIVFIRGMVWHIAYCARDSFVRKWFGRSVDCFGRFWGRRVADHFDLLLGEITIIIGGDLIHDCEPQFSVSHSS